ncbi:MAG: hypothetical protein JKY27_00610 [Magnetovibrio sp.]|nr:hypothetical protein [Magnetovibrio sp.]
MTRNDPKPKKYEMQDYDFGDNLLYHQPKPKKEPRQNDIKVLLVMCAFSFLVLGSFVAIQMVPGLKFNLGSLFSTIRTNEQPGYALGNVKLGTTLDVLRERHPNAQTGISSSGVITLAFAEKDARYTVWYAEDGPYHIAYKARQNQIITDMSEDDYISSIAKRYGAPSVSSCTRRLSDGLRDCRFSWWMPGKLRLDMNSRQNPNATTPRLMITLVATDTRMESRIRRARLNTKITNKN